MDGKKETKQTGALENQWGLWCGRQRDEERKGAEGMKRKKPSRPSRIERAGNLISDKDETKKGRAGRRRRALVRLEVSSLNASSRVLIKTPDKALFCENSQSTSDSLTRHEVSL